MLHATTLVHARIRLPTLIRTLVFKTLQSRRLLAHTLRAHTLARQPWHVLPRGSPGMSLPFSFDA